MAALLPLMEMVLLAREVQEAAAAPAVLDQVAAAQVEAWEYTVKARAALEVRLPVQQQLQDSEAILDQMALVTYMVVAPEVRVVLHFGNQAAAPSELFGQAIYVCSRQLEHPTNNKLLNIELIIFKYAR
jgi:hypothetical protein